MQLVAMDILGPFPESESGNSYILVVADYYTRWTQAYPIPDQADKMDSSLPNLQSLTKATKSLTKDKGYMTGVDNGRFLFLFSLDNSCFSWVLEPVPQVPQPRDQC